jgi:hypothetical protein
MDIKIDRNIPVPAECGKKNRLYPFGKMEPGDSFLINGFDPNRVRSAALSFGKAKSPKQKFSIRKTPEGHRCWRVS